jgi:hypothetical protein
MFSPPQLTPQEGSSLFLEGADDAIGVVDTAASLVDADWEEMAAEIEGEGGWAYLPVMASPPLVPTPPVAVTNTNMSQWYSMAHGQHPCPLPPCSYANDDGRRPFDAWHVLVECEAPLVQAARVGAVQYLPQVLHDITYALEKARGRIAPVPWHESFAQPALPSPDSIKARVASMDWQSRDGSFCLFHLLCGVPWSVWHVRQALPEQVPSGPLPTDQDDIPLCIVLGTMFDLTRCPHNLLRGVALRWSHWAGKAVLKICGAWGPKFASTSLGVSLR